MVGWVLRLVGILISYVCPVFSIGSVVIVCVIWLRVWFVLWLFGYLVLAICRVVASVSSFGWAGRCFLVGFMFVGLSGWCLRGVVRCGFGMPLVVWMV